MLRQVVGLGLVHEDELRVVAAYPAGTADLWCAVDVGVGVAPGVQGGDSLFGDLFEILNVTEHDGVGWTGLGTSRFQAIFLTVIAERALEDSAIFRDPGYDAVRTGGNAVAATVADVGLDIDAVELVADDRTRR